MKEHLSRARVGFLIFIGVVTFVVAIFLVGEKSQLFSSTFTIYVNFGAAEGVKKGTFVVLSGFNVGTVTDIQLSPKADSVRLTLRLSDRIKPFIKADSKAEIKQEGLVGNKIINVTTGTDDLAPIGEGGFIQGVAPFALTGLADNVAAMLDTAKIVGGELHILLREINEGRGTLGQLFKNPSLYNHFLDVTERTEQGLLLATGQLMRLTDLMGTVTRSVDLLVRKADTTVSSSNVISREVETLLHNLNTGKGTVGALLTDRKLYDSLITLMSALTDAMHDAGNASNQIAQSVHAMRGHWLFGRFMAGDEYDESQPPVSSYQQRMRELSLRAAELDRRERELEELIRKLGLEEKSNR